MDADHARAVLCEALRPLEDQIRFAFVFGSVATQEDTAQSDVDLLVVSESLCFGDVYSALQPASIALERPAHLMLYSLGQISKRVHQQNAFVVRVLERPKIWLIGSDGNLDQALISF